MTDTTTQARAVGRRERKKQHTRDLIAATALDLFLERGFDQVTVAQVAEAADVSLQTVFNHFRTKEDLVYRRLETFEDELLAGIRDRGPGESVIDAFRRLLLARHGLLGQDDPAARDRLVRINQMIESSTGLQRREEQVYTTRTNALAELLAAEGANGIEPWVVANALVGVHRALIVAARRALVDGVSSPRLATEITRQATNALNLLNQGLAGYPNRSAQRNRGPSRRPDKRH